MRMRGGGATEFIIRTVPVRGRSVSLGDGFSVRQWTLSVTRSRDEGAPNNSIQATPAIEAEVLTEAPRAGAPDAGCYGARKEATMGIEMKNPQTPLEKADALTNLVAQMHLAHMVRDEAHFKRAHAEASRIGFELVQVLAENEGA